MVNLEKMIRTQLIEEKAEEIYLLRIDPGYMAIIRPIIDGIIEEYPEIKEEMNENVLSLPAIKKQALETAEIRYNTRAEINDLLERARQGIEMFVGEDKLRQLSAAETAYLESIDRLDSYVTGLVEIAKEKGVEAALSTESRDKVYRQLFPTAGEYVAFQKGLDENMKNYGLCLANIISEEADKEFIGDVSRTMGTIVEKCSEYTQQQLAVKVKREATRIYGGK